MRFKKFPPSLFALLSLTAKGQYNIKNDSLSTKQLDEITVTATRSERKLSNVAVPVTIISQKMIQQSGSLRLNEILSQQTGLFITNSSGAGLQMQGLNPDYTLILIDGEPLIGRNSGVLDLSRVTVAGIKKIEIVKGPSSSLYGSEAMAGVVNIITDKPASTTAGASLRYGSFRTTDLNVHAAVVNRKFNLMIQANRYGTDGYNLNNGPAPTQDPFHNYTFQLRSAYSFTQRTKWIFSTRYFRQDQETKPYTTKNAADSVENISGNATLNDINIHNTFEHRFSDKTKSALRIYFTSYKAVTNQYYTYRDPAQNSSYFDYFRQQFIRFEDQTDFAVAKNLDITTGGGWVLDNVRSNRYGASIESRKNNIGYLFYQTEWRPSGDWNILTGVRFDYNQAYQSHLSPKLAFQKKFGSRLRITASIGGGFKAPDFRQLYLNFTNSSVGYTVLGSKEVQEGFQRLQQQGQIQTVLIDPSTLKPLRPETSIGINLGANYSLTRNINVTINFFRNDINNMINTGMIAQKINNQYIYSYFNVNKVYTQGLETELSWKIGENISIQAGYQLLYTADKDQLAQIKAGKVFGRDNGIVYRLTPGDYKGLFGRSRHMGNLKIWYEHKEGWLANIRNTFRSGWGVEDLDGNLILNRGDKFAGNYFQSAISGGKTFTPGVKIQAGMDNIFNYKDPRYLPELPGRTAYITLSYSLNPQHKKRIL